MSEKKKPKVIHVDKLIVNADEVVIVDEHGRERPRSPWGFRPFPRRADDHWDEGSEHVGRDADDDHDEHEESDEGRRRPPFSWI